ncbi:MAG: hypothetical protein OCC49_13360 [Fibrobacterales bacterium]
MKRLLLALIGIPLAALSFAQDTTQLEKQSYFQLPLPQMHYNPDSMHTTTAIMRLQDKGYSAASVLLQKQYMTLYSDTAVITGYGTYQYSKNDTTHLMINGARYLDSLVDSIAIDGVMGRKINDRIWFNLIKQDSIASRGPVSGYRLVHEKSKLLKTHQRKLFKLLKKWPDLYARYSYGDETVFTEYKRRLFNYTDTVSLTYSQFQKIKTIMSLETFRTITPSQADSIISGGETFFSNIGLANWYCDNNQPDAANTLYQTLLKQPYDSIYVYTNKALCNLEQYQLQAAVAIMDTAQRHSIKQGYIEETIEHISDVESHFNRTIHIGVEAASHSYFMGVIRPMIFITAGFHTVSLYYTIPPLILDEEQTYAGGIRYYTPGFTWRFFVDTEFWFYRRSYKYSLDPVNDRWNKTEPTTERSYASNARLGLQWDMGTLSYFSFNAGVDYFHLFSIKNREDRYHDPIKSSVFPFASLILKF